MFIFCEATLFSNTFLLSFPRSGNTWLRYIIEHTADSPTLEGGGGGINQPMLAQLQNHLYQYPPIFKTHFCHDVGQNDTLILVVRDYKECIIRHALHESNPPYRQMVDEYFKNLSVFDAHPNEKKLLIFYEDIVVDPKPTVEQLCHFLSQHSEQRIDSFFKDFETHKEQCLALYRKKIGPTVTNGQKIKFHNNEANREAIDTINHIVNEEHRELSEKYLERYL